MEKEKIVTMLNTISGVIIAIIVIGFSLEGLKKLFNDTQYSELGLIFMIACVVFVITFGLKKDTNYIAKCDWFF